MAKILIKNETDLTMNLISRIWDIAEMADLNTSDIPIFIDFDGEAEQVDFVGLTVEYITYLFVQIVKCKNTLHLSFAFHPAFDEVGIVLNFYPERFDKSFIDISINCLETKCEVNIF